MRRREFITLLGGAAAWPLVARAQQQAKVYRIGALFVGNADVESLRTELREALRKSGYVEGQNLLFEFRSAEEELDRLPRLAAELVALKVDVIVAIYTPCALAAQQATHEIPIVIVSGNPIETGLVPSLSRPGGNITGVSLIAAELHGKCVELFRDMLPSVRRVAALGNAADPISKLFLEQVQLAGRATGIEIAPAIMVRGAGEVDEAFAAMKKEGASAVVVQGSLASKNAAELALKRGLPAATVPRSFAEVGGCPTAPMVPTRFGGRPRLWSRFCRVGSRRRCRSSNPRNSSWSSTSRPPKRSASTCLGFYSSAPTR